MAGYLGAVRAIVDPSKTIASLQAAEKQVRFGTIVGLTATAKGATAAVKAAIPARFDRPIAFTRNAPAYVWATPDKTVINVFIKEVQAGYLALQETGGARRPKTGEPITVPAKNYANAAGNIPRAQFKKIAADRQKYFVVGRRKTAKTAHLAPGFYQRTKSKGKVRRPGVRLLIGLAMRAEYKRRFGFRGIVTGYAAQHIHRHIAEGIARAFATSGFKGKWGR
jgi:hypothetical protein